MTVRVFAQGTVNPENRQAFILQAEKLIKKIQETEAGTTLVYEFYLSDSDEAGNCVIHEAYVSGEDLARHIVALGDDFAVITQLFQPSMMRIAGKVPQFVIDTLSKIGDLENHPTLVDANSDG